MGCDIHAFVEYYKDDAWHPAEPWIQDDRYGDGKDSWRVPEHLGVPTSRDYDWFGFLADVRNGTWGEPMPVLHEPKGLPADCCERIKAESDDWNGDGHSHSFFTLKELEDGYRQHRETPIWFNGSILNADPAWIALPEDKRPKPGSYSAGGWGPNGEHPKYRWCVKLGDEIGTSYHAYTRYLRNAAYEYSVSPEQIRLVFWFDN